MRVRAVLLVATTLGAVLTTLCAPASAVPATRQLFTLHDPRLTEVSGIAAGIVSPGVDYVENDSGDSARFFALDGTTGDVLAEFHVPDATNVDWEDIAVAPDAQGTPSVWLADIGDNDSVRSSIAVYRVDEPHVLPGHPEGVRTTTTPQTWRLAYPDGSHDAESLAVTPAGVGYVITKAIDGVDGVYRLPPAPAPDGSVQTMTRVGTLAIPTALPTPPGLLVTGADISADGTELVVRTYLTAYLWTIAGGTDPVGDAVTRAPTVVPLPVEPQGEAVAFTDDGHALLIASEKVNTPVYEVFLPSEASPSAVTATSSATVRSSASAAGTSGHRSPLPWVLIGVVVVAGAVGAFLLRRRPGRSNG